MRGLDLEVVSVSTKVVFDDKSSSDSSVVSELEQNVIIQWLSSVQSSLLIQEPGLVKTVVAVPEDHVSVVSVGSTVDVKTFSSIVLEVSVCTLNPSDLNGVVVGSHWSDSGGNSNSESLSKLVSENVGSLGPGSDGVGSLVESEPLL